MYSVPHFVATIVLGHRICRVLSSSTFPVAAIVSDPSGISVPAYPASVEVSSRMDPSLSDGSDESAANSPCGSWGQRELLLITDILSLCDKIEMCTY